MPINDSEERYNKILNGLYPPKCTSGIVPVDKWLTTPDMGHIIASCYKRVVILLTLSEMGGVCKTYFPIRSAPPLNPHSNIMCLYLIPDHYGSNHRTRDVIVNVAGLDLGEDKEEGF